MKEEYEIGKWYKANGHYIKPINIKDTYYSTPGGEHITVYDSEYLPDDSGYDDLRTWTLVTNLQEIQKYLPDGHKDKFSPISKEQKQKLLNLIREI